MTDERTLTSEQLDALEEYYRSATEGEWFRGEGRYSVWARLPDVDGEEHTRCIAHTSEMKNSGLIVEMHNAMPALLAMARRVRALEAENARLQRIVELDEQIERMWGAGDYEAELRKLSPDEFRRLHENQWIPPEGSE